MLTSQFKKDQTVHNCHSSPWFSPRIIATIITMYIITIIILQTLRFLRHQPLHQSHSAARLYLPEGELGNKERRPINNQAKSFSCLINRLVEYKIMGRTLMKRLHGISFRIPSRQNTPRIHKVRPRPAQRTPGMKLK